METNPAVKTIRRSAIPAAALVLFLILCVLHLSSLFSEDTRRLLSWFLDLPLRALVLLSLADGISRLKTPGERRFWSLTLAAFSAWFIADMAFQTGGDRPLILGLLEDGAFLLFYPLLMIAIEQRPCRFYWPITGWGSRLLCAASGLFLILWCYTYFAGLTLVFETEAFLSEAPSYLFFAFSDFIFAIAFFIRALIIRGRWRVIYALFGVAMLIWGVTDLMDAYGLLGIDTIPFGTPLDVLWPLPYFAIITAAVYRNRSALSARPLPQTTTTEGTLIVSSYAYAFGIPIIHLIVFTSGWLREIEIQREITVLAGLVVLFSIALTIQARERRRRRLTQEPRIFVLEDEEQQVQRMEALGRLAGGIAHDFNNLLMVLQSQIDTRSAELRELSRGEEFVGELQNVVRRGSDLSHQLLAFGRKQVSQVRVVDPRSIIGATESMLRRTLGADIELEISIADDVWPIAIDPGQLNQVLVNLALNARSAMSNGGRLAIRVDNVVVDHGDADVVGAEQYVQLEASDTGRGMDEKTRARVFEPFFSGKSTASGTGLGLAVVYGIVKQHGGHVTCESTEDIGTIFRVHFPRSGQSATPIPDTVSPEIDHSGGSETILLAEDEPEVRSAVAEYLRSTGYLVAEAGNGFEAIEVADSIKGPIDLLLTDIVMPKMGGPELADRLAENRPETSVLFVTGYAENFPLDVNGDSQIQVLQKPFSLVTLGAKIREVLDH